MKSVFRVKVLLIISVIALFLVSVSITLMPFASMQKEKSYTMPLYIVGGGFWLCLIIGYSSLLVLNRRRKKQCGDTGEKSEDRRRIGLFHMCSNRPAKVFDILAAVSFIALILVFIINSFETQLIFSLMALLFFSLNMHAIFNGSNYIFIKYYAGSAEINE